MRYAKTQKTHLENMCAPSEYTLLFLYAQICQWLILQQMYYEIGTFAFSFLYCKMLIKMGKIYNSFHYLNY
jgi:hypothetical protein